jgi:hypothetical protein
MTADPPAKPGDDHPNDRCRVCQTRLAPWLIRHGYTTHPNCDPDERLT